jgi:hypothetical protein
MLAPNSVPETETTTSSSSKQQPLQAARLGAEVAWPALRIKQTRSRPAEVIGRPWPPVDWSGGADRLGGRGSSGGGRRWPVKIQFTQQIVNGHEPPVMSRALVWPTDPSVLETDQEILFLMLLKSGAEDNKKISSPRWPSSIPSTSLACNLLPCAAAHLLPSARACPSTIAILACVL